MAKKNTETSYDFKITFKPQEGMGGGFRQEWVSGEGEGFVFGMDTGAGLGNPMLTIWIERNGKREYFDTDIRELLTDFVTCYRKVQP